MKLLPSLLLLALACAQVRGFSPYENQLISDPVRRIGLLALLPPGHAAQVSELSGVAPPPEDLAEAGITNMQFGIRELDGTGYAFAYFETRKESLEDTMGVVHSPDSQPPQLVSHLTPHPRAAKAGHLWLRMELINRVASSTAYPHGSRHVERKLMMSGLKPERETEYRALHQANWPGVSEALAEHGFRNWTTFLVEHGEDLRLFTYFEYIGEDRDADGKALGEEPVIQRWWKQTEPCLIDLAGEGNWTPMHPIR